MCGISLWRNNATGWEKYYFLKNLQGDVLAIYKSGDSFTKVGEYTYDSWGNVLSVTGVPSNDDAATLNPFRYRSYYQDPETGFYYLRSRYYDPSIGRFIGADRFVSTGQSFIGYNMFSYCLNNPIRYVDATGCNCFDVIKKGFDSIRNTFDEWVVTPLSNFASDIWEDICNFDLFNTSEDKVLKSNYFCMYNGVPVVRVDGDRSGSFGVIFLTRETNDRINPEDVVRHEYGHTRQLEQLGPIKFLMCIGLPSWQEWGSKDYYNKPWEVTADVYGGVQSRTHSQSDVDDGSEYLRNSYYFGPWVLFTIE